jgi:hypothetical protein
MKALSIIGIATMPTIIFQAATLRLKKPLAVGLLCY